MSAERHDDPFRRIGCQCTLFRKYAEYVRVGLPLEPKGVGNVVLASVAQRKPELRRDADPLLAEVQHPRFTLLVLITFFVDSYCFNKVGLGLDREF